MPVCELCGGTSFVKVEGMFQCQGCGTKYSPEEAKKLTGQAAPEPQQTGGVTVVINTGSAEPAPAPAPEAVAATPVPPADTLNTAAEFRPSKVNVADMGAREANNYVCRGWQLLLDQYNKTEHPAPRQQEILVERAKECLMLLDAAARLEPNLHVQNSIIYGNAHELVESVRDTKSWTKNDNGEWKGDRLSYSVSLKLPGQHKDWDDLADEHKEFLRQEYISSHADDWGQRSALEAEAARIQEQLGELKDETKSHSFFDFAGKREVKDRMKPVQDQLNDLRKQIRAYDSAADDYVEQRIAEHDGEYVILYF